MAGAGGGGGSGGNQGAGGSGGGGTRVSGADGNATGIGAGGAGGNFTTGGTGSTGAIYLSYPLFCTGYTFTGPTSGSKDVASSNFTVTPTGPVGCGYSGTISLAVTGGGISSPITKTFSGTGTAQTFTITPSVAGDVTLTPTSSPQLGTDPAAITYNIPKTNQAALSFTISTTSKSYPYSQAVTFTPSGGSGSGTITYAIATPNTSGCALANNGATNTITSTSSGTCLVRATKASSTNYLEATSSTVSFTFSRATQNALTITTTSFNYGATLSLATSGGLGTGDVSYVVNSGNCSLSGSTLSATSAGTCSVTATKAEDVNYSALSSSATTITVNQIAQNTLSFTINTTSKSYPYSQAVTFTPSGGSGSGTITYAIATPNTSGCALANNGATNTITSTSSGTCLVRATKASSTNYLEATSSTVSFTFSRATQNALTITTTSGYYKTSLTIATSGGLGTGALSFTLNSGNCTIIGGAIIGNQVGGTCAVTATKASDDNYESISSSSTNITFARGVLTGDLYFQPSITRATYQTAYPLLASASQLSKVTFLANGVSIPGCSAVPTKVGVGAAPSVATCQYKPITLGSVTLTATITPNDSGFQALSRSTKVTVNPK